MKITSKLIQIVFILITFLIMILLIWGVMEGKVLNSKETDKQILNRMLKK